MAPLLLFNCASSNSYLTSFSIFFPPEWLSLEYAAEPVPDSIIVQRMQEFALARREHEQFYSIDWKYQAQVRTLPNWPEAREDMQTRLDRALAHVIHSYGRVLQNKDREMDLSIVFVTHASPVNGKICCWSIHNSRAYYFVLLRCLTCTKYPGHVHVYLVC